jgi:hypothetical protein
LDSILQSVGGGKLLARIEVFSKGGSAGWHSHVKEAGQPEWISVWNLPIIMPKESKYSVVPRFVKELAHYFKLSFKQRTALIYDVGLYIFNATITDAFADSRLPAPYENISRSVLLMDGDFIPLMWSIGDTTCSYIPETSAERYLSDPNYIEGAKSEPVIGNSLADIFSIGIWYNDLPPHVRNQYAYYLLDIPDSNFGDQTHSILNGPDLKFITNSEGPAGYAPKLYAFSIVGNVLLYLPNMFINTSENIRKYEIFKKRITETKNRLIMAMEAQIPETYNYKIDKFYRDFIDSHKNPEIYVENEEWGSSSSQITDLEVRDLVSRIPEI